MSVRFELVNGVLTLTGLADGGKLVWDSLPRYVAAITTPTPTDPTGPLVWEDGFTIPDGVSVIENRNFQNYDPLRPLFTLPSGRRVTFRNCRFRSAGHVFSGFRSMLTITNCSLEVLPPSDYGRPPARLLNLQEVMDLVFESNDVLAHGRGIYLSGYADTHPLAGTFAGDPALGQGISVRFNRIRNPDGRYSDGADGYIQSNWGTPHQGSTVRQNRSGIIGWEVAPFVHLHGLPGTPIVISWNEVLCDLGKARAETLIHFTNGSGGSASGTAIVENNFLQVSGGFDWRFVPGVSTTYDGSNQITTGATGYQDTTKTQYTGAAIVVADSYRTIYEQNSSHLLIRNNVIIGVRAYLSLLSGHHTRIEDNRLYRTAAHHTGVPYSGYFEGNYSVVNSRGTQAASNGQMVWGYHGFNTNHRYAGTVEQVLKVPTDILTNGGNGAGNLQHPAVTDGGLAALVAWRQSATLAGVVVGRTSNRETLS